MTQNEKQLLLKDLSARLPYGVECQTKNGIGTMISIECSFGENLVYVDFDRSEAEEYNLNDGDTVKPYLRPMSSMTEEEDKEWQLYKRSIAESCDRRLEEKISALHDWFNSRHLDWRGLIPMGLALEALEEMYNSTNNA